MSIMNTSSSPPNALAPALTVVAVVESDFTGKFGVPRQPGLSPSARGRVRLCGPYARAEALAGLEGVSHVWLLFWFHQTAGAPWRPTVRPPRLGGNRRLGVFATRSTYRPNPIGLSVVKVESVVTSPWVGLEVSGLDLVHGTPIVDIKPYLPYADALESAVNPWAGEAPVAMTVVFAPAADLALSALGDGVRIRRLLEEILALDPRPAYQRDTGRLYHLEAAGVEVRFRIDEPATIEVCEVIPKP